MYFRGIHAHYTQANERTQEPKFSQKLGIKEKFGMPPNTALGFHKLYSAEGGVYIAG